jgi:hypothetical protein
VTRGTWLDDRARPHMLKSTRPDGHGQARDEQHDGDWNPQATLAGAA